MGVRFFIFGPIEARNEASNEARNEARNVNIVDIHTLYSTFTINLRQCKIFLIQRKQGWGPDVTTTHILKYPRNLVASQVKTAMN